MKLPYNPKDKNSVLEYAKKLKRQSLRDACAENITLHTISGKGNFGQILEKYYFGYDPNSKSEADFLEIGLELKSSPLKIFKKNEYRAKERLVLNIINYLNIVDQSFENSDFWKKNACLLLVFYEHKFATNVLDLIIKLVGEWSFPETDLAIIRNDWEVIKQKVLLGKAHELSEGDTFYLGACTKGASANSVRIQPFSALPAKQRAYSLKQGYVNHIIATIGQGEQEVYGKFIDTQALPIIDSVEQYVIQKLSPYLGKTPEEIALLSGLTVNKKAKNYFANVTKGVLNTIFEKAEIVVKTIRVEQNNRIKESVSFPTFDFIELYNDSWRNSKLKDLTEKKFLFLFFKNNGQDYVFEKVKFWNMPFDDRNEVRKVWLRTKQVIQSGKIVAEVNQGKERKKFLWPKITENKVSHVRPHGKNSKDTLPLPVQEKLTKAKEFTKQCFWLNWDYIRDEIYLR